MASRMDRFDAVYFNNPFDDQDGRQIYEAAQEYIRRVTEHEEKTALQPPHSYTSVSAFAARVVKEIAAVRNVDLNKLRRRIFELQR